MVISVFAGKSVFLISPEEWSFIKVSKHHYAIELARRGARVYFINPPNRAMFRGIRVSPAEGYSNIFTVDYGLFLRGTRFLGRWITRFIDRLFLRKLERLEGREFNIIWSFENSRFYDFGFAPAAATKIYFQVDINQAFHPKIAATTADYCFAINNEIFLHLRKYRDDCVKIPHSFHGKLGAGVRAMMTRNLRYPREVGRVRVVYVGNLNHAHLDIDLFEKLVDRNINVDFHLVGPYHAQTALHVRLDGRSNVQFLGKVDADMVPEVLESADIVVLIYDDEFSQSSHKLLEYLASGRVVLSTYMSEFRGRPDLIEMTRGHEEFLEKFDEIVANLDHYNGLERMRARVSYALEHTYERQLSSIERLLTTRASVV